MRMRTVRRQNLQSHEFHPSVASVRLDERDNLRADATTGERFTDREGAEPTRFHIVKPGAYRPGQLTI